MKVSPDTAVKASFAIAFLILLGIGSYSYRCTKVLISTARQVAETHQTIGKLDDLRAQVLEVESAARGFVVAGEVYYLDPFKNAIPQLVQTTQELEQVLGNNPEEEHRMRHLSNLVSEKIAHVHLLIEQRKTGGYEAAQRILTSGEGHALMDAIRDDISAISIDEERLGSQQEFLARTDAEKSLVALIFGSLVSVAILALIFRYLIREIARRRQGEEEIRVLNQDLERRVIERTSELALANKTLEARNREIERANRVKSEFLARMSHELRTPLNAIIGFSDILIKDQTSGQGETHTQFLGYIQDGARHLLQLINEILDIAKIEAGRVELSLEAFPVLPNLDEVVSLIRPLAMMKKIQLEFGTISDFILQADLTRFKQIIFNLLSNAVKFTPENGKIWIETAQDGNFSYISVRDTGIGIAQEEHEAIFDEFHQVEAAKSQGTGLGLTITKKLVALHGGRIWVESTPGEGSRFTFTLPAFAASQSIKVPPVERELRSNRAG